MVRSIVPVRKIKRLFYDVEVSHNVVLAFRAGFKLNINPDDILSERKIICIAYKWEGEKKVHVLRWDKNQDDKELLKDFLFVSAQADELVTHNGDRYDGPTIRTRCLFHNLPPLPSWKTCDTCQWAKRYFNFNSMKLDYIAKFLGMKGKKPTGFKLWKDVLVHNCPKALNKMCSYCAWDVITLEGVYQRMKFCVKPKTHVGVLNGLDKWTCPRTGSKNVMKQKTRITAAGVIQHQMQSKDDGSYYTISDSAFKGYLKHLKNDRK